VIGVTGQFSAVDTLLTGQENLILMARLDLVDAAGTTAATYSGGMRRRLDLAMTPGRHAAGDLPRRADRRTRPAQSPRHVADRAELVADGVTSFLTTRYLEEADEFADASPSSTAGGSSSRAPRPSSSGASPAATSCCGSPTSATSRPRPVPWVSRPATATRSPSGAARRRHEVAQGPCSTGSTRTRSRSTC